MMQAVNSERTQAGVPSLQHEDLLFAVVQEYADELSRQATLPSGDASQVLMGRLNDRGYRAYRLVLGLAQIAGPFPEVLQAWRKGDPAVYERMLPAELHDFALGIGEVRDSTFYIAVAAVRQREFYEAASAELRSDLEKARRDELRRVNALRAANGAATLSRHPTLDLIAQQYAEDMLARNFYGHFSPEGQDVGDRAEAARYAYREVGENIASGQSSVEAVMQGWVASPEHFENLLDPDFTQIGIGFAAGPGVQGGYRFLWVQVFGRPLKP